MFTLYQIMDWYVIPIMYMKFSFDYQCAVRILQIMHLEGLPLPQPLPLPLWDQPKNT